MSGKRIALSFGLGLAAGLCAYFVAWGLFTTHPELGMPTSAARTIAIWVSSIGFLVSLVYFAAKDRRR